MGLNIHEMSEAFLDCLKRKRDISIKSMLSGVKKVSGKPPVLRRSKKQISLKISEAKYNQSSNRFYCLNDSTFHFLNAKKPVINLLKLN